MNGALHSKNIEFRKKKYERNPRLDDLLRELKELLEPVEEKVMQRFTTPEKPVLFLVGNSRTGSTPLIQFLQSTGQFAIPTNIMSRFYYAPYIGAKIQQLLYNPAFDFCNELARPNKDEAFSSSLGKTVGPLGVSEILHFWRRFIPYYDPQYIAPEPQKEIDTVSLAAELAAIESVFRRPLALKATLLTFNLAHLRKCASSSLFFYLRRDPLFIAQSLLVAREKFYGRRDLWWSFMPKEYEQLKEMDTYHQIAGQVFFTSKSIEDELSRFPTDQQLTIDYESFCFDPASVYEQIARKYEALGCYMKPLGGNPAKFTWKNEIRISRDDFNGLRSA
jgi:hypothetical protein